MSYLRSWFSFDTAASGPAVPTTHSPSSSHTIPGALILDDEDDDGSDTAGEDDIPPAFPSLSSAQRAAPSSVPIIITDSTLMPPPPVPGLAARRPGVNQTSSSASLLAPMTTTRRPQKASRREKVALAPGFGPLDWASLKSSGQDLRNHAKGVDTLLRVPPSVLKLHNKREDAWTAINGKVYNITPYLPFHPGGDKELMRVAGRDGTKLFSLTHAWVNADFMLDACLVGFLVSEPTA
ncbi:cytochrome b5-like heme/steroid binding domain-containing protein [Hygrophoropsis aurantiaca]|uniref:Cytochrome b5-like heme/steroid binding domain-containing protein n=1 Tax=Hygrophoropsis aurantiaca TaxID=72124 RepID=A0ACB8AKE9_9AGAM|nr:cytochrome b5-like heme/steroid binding domain-containing protein [Hygrophoropsis aurantiaca]